MLPWVTTIILWGALLIQMLNWRPPLFFDKWFKWFLSYACVEWTGDCIWKWKGISRHYCPCNSSEKSSSGYDATHIYRPSWTVCLCGVYSKPLIMSALMMSKENSSLRNTDPFPWISSRNFRSLVLVHPTGSIRGLTYLGWSSVQRSWTSYSLWTGMEEVSCLKVICSHIGI